jgi:4-hydroxybutyryl-CoA dehydratase/vinylacetyl-CoA-Delta-isomerase
MAGAAALIARANGLSTKAFNERLIQMYINNETTFGMGVAASALGKKHPSGAWLTNPLLANVNKVHVGTLPYDTKRIVQDIAGGIGETGCLPSYADFTDPNYGHLVRKYLKAASSAESRAKIARLIEWLTLGGGVPGCMHGGGSPEGAKLMIRLNSSLEESVAFAHRLAEVEEDISEPAAKR